MSKINLESAIGKVIERKSEKSRALNERLERRHQIMVKFHEYVANEVEFFRKLFPVVIISEVSGTHSSAVIAVSNSAGECYAGNSTYNVEMSSTKEYFHVGYSANSAGAGGGKAIPFRLNMDDDELEILFVNILKYLVIDAYSEHSEYYKEGEKNSRVWIGRELDIRKIYVEKK